MRMASELLLGAVAEGQQMELLVISGALVGSFAGAFFLQKAALEALFRAMFHQ
jgi:hypothetical protein